MTIEKGTIFRNCYATLKTYFIYDHTVTQRHTQFAVGYGLVYIGGKWELNKNVKYYNTDLINDNKLEAVGKIDIDALIVKAITEEIEKRENPRACKYCKYHNFRKSYNFRGYELFCEKDNTPKLYEDICSDFETAEHIKKSEI